MRTGISPSQFSKVMTSGRGKTELFGATAKSYAEEIVMRMYGVEPDHFVSKEMMDGIEREPLAVRAYEMEKFVTVEGREPRLRQVHPVYEYISGECDGLVGKDGMIEVKCPKEINHFKNLLDGAQIEQYKWQIQGYMWIYGRDWCDFVSYHPNFPDHLQLSVNRVVRDDEMIEELSARCVAFWEELVLPLKEQMEQLNRP